MTMSAQIASARIVLIDDDTTPEDFVVDLLVSVFAKAEPEARELVQRIGLTGRIECGPYPAEVARALLDAATGAIARAGHPLELACEQLPQTAEACDFCGQQGTPTKRVFKGRQVFICEDCVRSNARQLDAQVGARTFKYCYEALNWHFADIRKDEILTSTRMFPATLRADLQKAVERLFARDAIRLFGVQHRHRYEPLSVAQLLEDGNRAQAIAPVQTEDIETGDDEPVRCFDHAVWLRRDQDLNYIVVLGQFDDMGARRRYLRVEIGVPAGEAGAELTAGLFRELEAAARSAQCYRGRVLSLEQETRFDGAGGSIRVHRLETVAPEHLILPAATRALIDRNVLVFAGQREKLRALGQSTKKGILLYGPPGTGKTHTIRYLASNLPGHTTLIITAEQVALLSDYFTLARLLQPAILVIDDVDLVARNRTQMGSACEEVLLNRILNEMDGLSEDADLFFVLTTNRPEQIEPALASRPGRIDQAIEIPLPDAEGREKLVRLYSAGLELSRELAAEAVGRTAGVSAAFIKELMRRIAQATIARDDDGAPGTDDLRQALDEMLFVGGRLNAALLGGATDTQINGRTQ
jgi:ATP-dependent Clp protease adapter protein ClpS